MFNMFKQVITLYIDATSIKLLVAKGNEVKKWATLPLESGLVKDGVVVDKTIVTAKIKELLKAQKVRGRKVVAGLSGLHCIFRVISLPRLPETMLAEGIMWEAKRVMPVPLEESYLSWQALPASGEETQVFLAALPRKATDALIETLREAGVKPYLMDAAPLALARVVSETTAIIVDIRSTEIDIVTMVAGIPQLIRSVPLPGEAPSLQEKLPTIREELKRTIKFYNSSHPEPLEPSVPIFASGKLGEEPEACQSLAEELNYSVLPLTSPLKCLEDAALNQYMVNIGLALKELPLGKIANLSLVNLNVLPEVYKPTKPISLNRALSYAGIIVAALLLASLVMLMQSVAADTELIQSEIDVSNLLRQKRSETQQLLREGVAELETQVAELEVTRDVFSEVFNDYSWRQEMIYDNLELTTRPLTSTIVIDLTNVTHTSDTVTIDGKAQDEMDILAYANILRASHRFPQVLISFLQKTETETETEEIETGMDFTLTLSVKGKD